MNPADILIVVAFVLPAVIGAAYGFLNIILSILAWVLALGLAATFGDSFAPFLEGHVATPFIREILAFIGVFLVSLMLLSLLGFLVLKLLGRAGLTAADRMLGLCFGIGLGGAIIAVVVFLAGFTALPQKRVWQESVLLPPFVAIATWSEQFLPANMVEYHGYGALPDSETGEG